MQDQSTDALHEQIEALRHNNWRVRAILHAMVDLGRLTSLECQLPECYMESRAFDAQQDGRLGHNAKGLVLDHIIPQLQGGNDRLENLRAIHGTCNVRRARGWKMAPEARAKISAAIQRDGGWRRAVEGRAPGWNRKLSEDQVMNMRQGYKTGRTIGQIAADQGVSYSTARAAIHGIASYASV
jgi:hypothetical protein